MRAVMIIDIGEGTPACNSTIRSIAASGSSASQWLFE
jgi:hypothetical protein